MVARRRNLLALLGAAVLGATGVRWGAGFVAGGLRSESARGAQIARQASDYEPILRRDPFVQENMQRWVRQMVKMVKREEGLREDDSMDAAAARKAAYLAKLGLAQKAASVQASTGKKADWHLEHMKAGDVFQGTFEHPDFEGGQKMDLTFTASSATEGSWSSEKGGFESDVTVRQDFPITHEQGPDRDTDLASYIFHKFSMKWRDFEGPYPSADELEYLNLEGLQLYFKYVAEVEGFPSADVFEQECADPSKGMTKEEFLAFIKSDDPEYIEKTFMNVYTGRRVNLEDAELKLDGDFQKEAKNHIFGYVSYEGRPGGTFELILRQ